MYRFVKNFNAAVDPATIKQKRNNKLRHFDGHCDQGVIREIIDPDEVLNSSSNNNENIPNGPLYNCTQEPLALIIKFQRYKKEFFCQNKIF